MNDLVEQSNISQKEDIVNEVAGKIVTAVVNVRAMCPSREEVTKVLEQSTGKCDERMK